MSDDSKEILYKEYKLKGKSNFKSEYEDTNAKIKGTIVGAFRKQSGISDEKYKELEVKYSDIKYIKSKFTKERAKGSWLIIDFYDWYKKQRQSCAYCGVSQGELSQVFKGKDLANKDKLPLISKIKEGNRIKRLYGTLEIERRDSDKEYSERNCILACPLCNNAKSNLIDEDSWRLLFVEPMREYYKKLLGKDLENKPEKLTAKKLN